MHLLKRIIGYTCVWLEIVRCLSCVAMATPQTIYIKEHGALQKVSYSNLKPTKSIPVTLDRYLLELSSDIFKGKSSQELFKSSGEKIGSISKENEKLVVNITGDYECNVTSLNKYKNIFFKGKGRVFFHGSGKPFDNKCKIASESQLFFLNTKLRNESVIQAPAIWIDQLDNNTGYVVATDSKMESSEQLNIPFAKKPKSFTDNHSLFIGVKGRAANCGGIYSKGSGIIFGHTKKIKKRGTNKVEKTEYFYEAGRYGLLPSASFENFGEINLGESPLEICNVKNVDLHKASPEVKLPEHVSPGRVVASDIIITTLTQSPEKQRPLNPENYGRVKIDGEIYLTKKDSCIFLSAAEAQLETDISAPYFYSVLPPNSKRVHSFVNNGNSTVKRSTVQGIENNKKFIVQKTVGVKKHPKKLHKLIKKLGFSSKKPMLASVVSNKGDFAFGDTMNISRSAEPIKNTGNFVIGKKVIVDQSTFVETRYNGLTFQGNGVVAIGNDAGKQSITFVKQMGEVINESQLHTSISALDIKEIIKPISTNGSLDLEIKTAQESTIPVKSEIACGGDLILHNYANGKKIDLVFSKSVASKKDIDIKPGGKTNVTATAQVSCHGDMYIGSGLKDGAVKNDGKLVGKRKVDIKAKNLSGLGLVATEGTFVATGQTLALSQMSIQCKDLLLNAQKDIFMPKLVQEQAESVSAKAKILKVIHPIIANDIALSGEEVDVQKDLRANDSLALQGKVKIDNRSLTADKISVAGPVLSAKSAKVSSNSLTINSGDTDLTNGEINSKKVTVNCHHIDANGTKVLAEDSHIYAHELKADRANFQAKKNSVQFKDGKLSNSKVSGEDVHINIGAGAVTKCDISGDKVGLFSSDDGTFSHIKTTANTIWLGGQKFNCQNVTFRANEVNISGGEGKVNDSSIDANITDATTAYLQIIRSLVTSDQLKLRTLNIAAEDTKIKTNNLYSNSKNTVFDSSSIATSVTEWKGYSATFCDTTVDSELSKFDIQYFYSNDSSFKADETLIFDVGSGNVYRTSFKAKQADINLGYAAAKESIFDAENARISGKPELLTDNKHIGSNRIFVINSTKVPEGFSLEKILVQLKELNSLQLDMPSYDAVIDKKLNLTQESVSLNFASFTNEAGLSAPGDMHIHGAKAFTNNNILQAGGDVLTGSGGIHTNRSHIKAGGQNIIKSDRIKSEVAGTTRPRYEGQSVTQIAEHGIEHTGADFVSTDGDSNFIVKQGDITFDPQSTTKHLPHDDVEVLDGCTVNSAQNFNVIANGGSAQATAIKVNAKKASVQADLNVLALSESRDYVSDVSTKRSGVFGHRKKRTTTKDTMFFRSEFDCEEAEFISRFAQVFLQGAVVNATKKVKVESELGNQLPAVYGTRGSATKDATVFGGRITKSDRVKIVGVATELNSNNIIIVARKGGVGGEAPVLKSSKVTIDAVGRPTFQPLDAREFSQTVRYGALSDQNLLIGGAMLITIWMPGPGSAIANAIGLQGTTAVMAAAGINSIASQFVFNSIVNKGDCLAAIKQISLKTAAASAAGAGIADKVLSKMELDSEIFSNRLLTSVVKGGATFAANRAILNNKIEDDLQLAAIQTVAEVATTEIGIAYKSDKLNSNQHGSLHWVTAFSTAMAFGQKPEAAAITASIVTASEKISETIFGNKCKEITKKTVDGMKKQGAPLTQESFVNAVDADEVKASKIYSGKVGKSIGVLGGLLSGTLNTTPTCVDNAINNNFYGYIPQNEEELELLEDSIDFALKWHEGVDAAIDWIDKSSEESFSEIDSQEDLIVRLLFGKEIQKAYQWRVAPERGARNGLTKAAIAVARLASHPIDMTKELVGAFIGASTYLNTELYNIYYRHGVPELFFQDSPCRYDLGVTPTYSTSILVQESTDFLHPDEWRQTQSYAGGLALRNFAEKWIYDFAHLPGYKQLEKIFEIGTEFYIGGVAANKLINPALSKAAGATKKSVVFLSDRAVKGTRVAASTAAEATKATGKAVVKIAKKIDGNIKFKSPKVASAYRKVKKQTKISIELAKAEALYLFPQLEKYLPKPKQLSGYQVPVQNKTLIQIIYSDVRFSPLISPGLITEDLIKLIYVYGKSTTPPLVRRVYVKAPIEMTVRRNQWGLKEFDFINPYDEAKVMSCSSKTLPEYYEQLRNVNVETKGGVKGTIHINKFDETILGLLDQEGITIKGALGDTTRLINTHGGTTADWVKKSAVGTFENPLGAGYEIHWVENVATKQRVDLKAKPISSGKTPQRIITDPELNSMLGKRRGETLERYKNDYHPMWDKFPLLYSLAELVGFESKYLSVSMSADLHKVGISYTLGGLHNTLPGRSAVGELLTTIAQDIKTYNPKTVTVSMSVVNPKLYEFFTKNFPDNVYTRQADRGIHKHISKHYSQFVVSSAENGTDFIQPLTLIFRGEQLYDIPSKAGKFIAVAAGNKSLPLPIRSLKKLGQLYQDIHMSVENGSALGKIKVSPELKKVREKFGKEQLTQDHLGRPNTSKYNAGIMYSEYIAPKIKRLVVRVDNIEGHTNIPFTNVIKSLENIAKSKGAKELRIVQHITNEKYFEFMKKHYGHKHTFEFEVFESDSIFDKSKFKSAHTELTIKIKSDKKRRK